MNTTQYEMLQYKTILKECDLIHELRITAMNIPLEVFNPEILN